jgi:predicted TIM-barrel fold metal-dependent hydrolase
MKTEDLILISVDDHVTEPADMFLRHLPKSLHGSAPQLLADRDGNNMWVYEDRKVSSIGLNAVVGRPPEEYGCEPMSYADMRDGVYQVDKRIDDMNVNGILGSLCFGTFVGFDGGFFAKSKDKAQAHRMVQAYNDWHVLDWCGTVPGRLIPLGILPLWDPSLAAAEMRRLARMGCSAVTFPDNPGPKLGLPSIHEPFWDPVWAAAAEHDMVFCCHIGTGHDAPHASAQTPIEAWITTMPMAIANSAADWLYLQALQKYPKLTVMLSEGGIGWIPYFLERVDFVHKHHRAWTHSDFGGRLPSEVFREHFITCFIDDEFGIKNREAVGIDSICYECDYPHSDSVWPVSPENMRKTLEGVSEADINKITHLNAMRVLKYDPFSKFEPADCTVGALRAKARHVSTQPVSRGGGKPLEAGVLRTVTSGDVQRMMAANGGTK